MADSAVSHAGHGGHADHDLDDVAGFVDHPAHATDAIRAQVAGCPECASLVGDLRILASATAELAVPARTRDFRLSAEDAVHQMATSRAAEPVGAPGRLGFDMTTPAPDHATHDPLLIAADLDGTLDARDTGRVQDWLAACSTCATLRSDFETLAVATRMLPTPPRPRDFSLTESDAERVRGRSWGWRRALAAFDSPRASFTRPLAVGLTTMGLAGLLIANIPSVALLGAAGAAPMAAQTEMSTDVAAPALLAPAAGAAGAAGAPGSPAAIPGTAASPEADIAGEVVPGASAASRDAYANSGASPGSGSLGSGASPGSDSAKGTALYDSLGDDPVGGPSFLVLASVALLLSGLSLAFLRWWARRLSDA